MALLMQSEADPFFSELRDLATPEDDLYQRDPVGWVTDVLHEHLWSKQAEVAESVRDNRYTAVPSCHDAGKSFDASRIAAWWLSVHEQGSAFVVSTAPTFAQVRAILWREIGRAHRKGKLPGRVNQTEWHVGEELVGYGRKPADHDPAAFQGIHAEHVLVIIDEACGVPEPIWDAVDSLATNEGARVLAIGNPDDISSQFAKVCKPGSGWHVIHIDGYDTPNFSDEVVPDSLRPLLLSRLWVEERKERWGEDSPLFISKVRGQFAEVVEGALWNREMIDHVDDHYTPWWKRQVIGLDPSDGTAAGDEQGLCRVGISPQDHEMYVLESEGYRLPVLDFLTLAVEKAVEHQASIALEKNHGGEYLVEVLEQVMRKLGVRVPYNTVIASKSKMTRAEPVAMLYKQGKVHHVGRFDELESQMVSFTGNPKQKSPDRLDALVWACREFTSYALEAPSPDVDKAVAWNDDFVPGGAVPWS